MQRMKYKCFYCNYKFLRDKEFVFTKCPYCGRTGTISQDKEDSAARLLEEVSSIKKI